MRIVAWKRANTEEETYVFSVSIGPAVINGLRYRPARRQILMPRNQNGFAVVRMFGSAVRQLRKLCEKKRRES